MTQLSAFVARAGHSAEPLFLKLSADGQLDWVADPSGATPFESVREATRRALRLPAKLRAFGLLRSYEAGATV
jgi:hypothetical protein